MVIPTSKIKIFISDTTGDVLDDKEHFNYQSHFASSKGRSSSLPELPRFDRRIEPSNNWSKNLFLLE